MKNRMILCRRGACAWGIVLAMNGAAWAAGYEFEGVGARHVAKGGAAIAASNDWTAVYWNPGNLSAATQDGTRELGLEVFGGEAHAEDSNSLSNLPGIGAVFDDRDVRSPYVLAALGGAFPVGTRGAVGFGFYTPLLQGADFNDTAGGLSLDFENAAGLLVWNVSGSVEVTDRFAAGAGVNVLYGRIENRSTVTNFPLAGNTIDTDLEADGYGLEAVVGLRYEATDRLRLGAVYRSGSDVSLSGEATVNNTANAFLADERSELTFDLRHPPTAGIGAAYRATDRLDVSLDVNRTFWGRFSNATQYDTNGTFLVDSSNSFNWRNTWKLRAGAEFRVTEETNVLAGYSFDQPALDERSVDLSTAINTYMHNLSAGVAHRWGSKLETILGLLYGTGTRDEGNNSYKLSGWQAMFENRVRF